MALRDRIIAKVYQAMVFWKWFGVSMTMHHAHKAVHTIIDGKTPTTSSPPLFDDDDDGNHIDDHSSYQETSPNALHHQQLVVAADEDYASTPCLEKGQQPSALSSFEEIVEGATQKRIVVFLDYDGTLSPIVSDPNSAFMSHQMRSAVREVAKQFPTAIISGRSRDKVYEFVKLEEVYYAGSHGMDILAPPAQPKSTSDAHHFTTHSKGSLSTFQPAHNFLPEIKELLKELQEETAKIEGAFVEDNRYCISVHYRHVKDEEYETLEEKVKSILGKHKQFHVTRGKKVLEIRPSIEWNKGNAVDYLLDTLGFDVSDDDVLPFYIGDDKTDEDAFKVLKSRGKGCGIIVSSTPRETMASYSLRDPSEVLSFLLRLSKFNDNSNSAGATKTD